MNKKELWIAFCNEMLGKYSDLLGISRSELLEYMPKALEFAEEGDVDAQFICGLLSMIGQDHDPTWLSVAANQGSVDAYTMLGMALYCLPNTTPGTAEHLAAGVKFAAASQLGGEFAEKMWKITASEREEYDKENGVEYISDEQLRELTEVPAFQVEAATKRNVSEMDSGADDETCDGGQNSLDIEAIVRGFSSDSKNNFYVMPDIPSKKVNNFLAKFEYGVDDDSIIFFFDETVFGSGDSGVLVDANSVALF